MLDELAKRRPGFVEGVSVVLADGQAWQLRRPLVRFAPADNEMGFEVCMSLDGNDGYAALIAANEAAAEGVEVIRTELALARAVLVANYDLTGPEVGTLLRFSWNPKDLEGSRIRDEVMNTAMGRDPKPEAGGGESSPTPAE